jgi:hypothetical protein
MEDEYKYITRLGCIGGCIGTSIGGGVNILTNEVSGLAIGVSVGGGCAIGTASAVLAADHIYNNYLRNRPIQDAHVHPEPPRPPRDVDHDRRLLRYVRGLHTGNVQSLHGGRLVTTRTAPRPFPRHVLESISDRVHPEAIRHDNRLIRQAASGGGKEDEFKEDD